MITMATPNHSGQDRPWRAGTRGSPLALVQTRGFIGQLAAAAPAMSAGRLVEHVITTTGDTVQDRPLAEIGGKGLFAKEIHEALLDGRVDFAVHSLKDLETALPPGIVLGCVLRREDPRDALILGPGLDTSFADPLAALPSGALVGTSSVRRQAQLLARRPDLRMTVMRGNVHTRLRKLAEGTCQASLLAMAGMNRLGITVAQALPLAPAMMVPAVAQGIVGITVRAGASDLRAMLALIEDADSRVAADAERAMLARLDGSCRTPVAGYAELQPDGRLTLTGVVARTDGSFLLRRSETGPREDAARIGESLGAWLRAESPADLFA